MEANSGLVRLAIAAERIADVLEGKGGQQISVNLQTPISIQIDGQEISRQVIGYTLRQAAKGPSGLSGGNSTG